MGMMLRRYHNAPGDEPAAAEVSVLDALGAMTRDELVDAARDAGVTGYSAMNKAELARALAAVADAADDEEAADGTE